MLAMVLMLSRWNQPNGLMAMVMVMVIIPRELKQTIVQLLKVIPMLAFMVVQTMTTMELHSQKICFPMMELSGQMLTATVTAIIQMARRQMAALM